MSEWWKDLFTVLKEADVRQVGYVPDAGHSKLIKACIEENEIDATVLTTEEEGVALGAGAWLGGDRAALLMQSSGVGNCINMLSMNASCRMPLLMLVTMRGQWGEFNPWQVPMGQAIPEILRQAGVLVYEVDQADEVGPTAAQAARLTYNSQKPVAVLLSQRLVGSKSFGK
ncbi:thiamine pyrophosphate-binding protein [Hwanghaeella sp.]|uniref:thiamine pyrophosphate-binding protein n=1 Tax=Hwanghaeella sp. TaxID=2605943 RepID=UPI003CCBDBF8